MNNDLNFKRTCEFQGRNGTFKMAGVCVQPFFAKRAIVLQPITGKGMVGNCRLEIPAEEIPALISKLKTTMAELEP